MKTIKKIISFGLILMIAALFTAALKPGAQVPDFSLKDPAGKAHSLAEYKGNAAVALIYISTQCPVSNAYNERMAALHADYSSKGVVFLGINSNKKETPADIATHAKKNGLNFTILKDDKNVIADKFGATVTPEVFLLDSNLKLAYHGHIDDSQRSQQVKKQSLRDAIDELIAGKAVSTNSTKAFGCSIKRVR